MTREVGASRGGRQGRASRRGLTLIEITIALALAAAITATAVASLNVLTDAGLRSAATQITGTIKMSYDRAVMMRRTQRLTFDLDHQAFSVSYTEDPFSISAEKDKGAKGLSVEEALGDDARRDSIFDDPNADPTVKKALEGGLASRFAPDKDLDGGKPTPLPGGVKLSHVWTGHQEEGFTSGVAYLHFFRGGWTEPAIIELSDEHDNVMTLIVEPLTGRVRLYDHAIDVPKPVPDDDVADEEDE